MAVQVLTNPVAGTTAPASLAGALAQQDAEIIAGVGAGAGGRARRGVRLRGAALGGGPARAVGYSAAPEQWALASVGATLLARRHGLACDCYGPDTSAPLVDVQAGYQQALPTLVGALGAPARSCLGSAPGATPPRASSCW